MSAPTLVQIAAKLTSGQRRALMWLPADGAWRVADATAPRRVSLSISRRIGDPEKVVSYHYVLSIIEYGNALQIDPAKRSDKARLTPLGAAVRAIVAAEQVP